MSRTIVIPFLAISRAICRGSEPIHQETNFSAMTYRKGIPRGIHRRILRYLRVSIAVLIMKPTMRGSIGNEDYHLGRVWPPVEILQCLTHSRSDSFRSIATARSYTISITDFHLLTMQSPEECLHHTNVICKRSLLGDVRVILRWVIPVRDDLRVSL
jgi:hypothetical protein